MNYPEFACIPRMTLDTWAHDAALEREYFRLARDVKVSDVAMLRDKNNWTYQRALLEFMPASFVAEVKARCGIVDAPVREERWNEETCQFEEAV